MKVRGDGRKGMDDVRQESTWQHSASNNNKDRGKTLSSRHPLRRCGC